MTTYSRKQSFALLGLACLLTGSLSTLSQTHAQSPAKDTKPFTEKEPLLLTTSVKRVQAFVKERKAEEAREKAREAKEKKRSKSESKKEEKESKTDYYQAWLARTSQRAYPKDTVDDAAYANALSLRSQIPSAKLLYPSGSGGSSAPGMRVNAVGTIGAVGNPPILATPTWEFIGPRGLAIPYTTYYGPAESALTGRVGGLCFDPTNPEIIYLASSGGGIWKTTDRGKNWTPQAALSQVPYTSSVTTHPTNGQIVYVGTGDYDGGLGSGIGILRSTDGGANWQNVGRAEMQRTAVSAIVVDPDNPQVVVASTGRGSVSGGLWFSRTGGNSWTRGTTTTGTPIGGNFSSLKIARPQATTGLRYYYAACEYSGNYGIWRSADKGLTWTSIALPTGGTSGALRVAPSATNPNVVFFIRDADSKVYRGVRDPAADTYTWTDITTGMPDGYNWSQSFYDMHIGVGASTQGGTAQDAVYVGLITIAQWINGKWTDVGQTYGGNPQTHNDQHCIAFYPANNDLMVIGNDGGIYGMGFKPTQASAVVFDNRMNTNLGLTMFYSGAFHPTDPTRMIGGTQDNASPTALGDLKNWRNYTGGDGTGTAINPVNTRVQYGSAQGLALYRTTDEWASSGNFNPNWKAQGDLPPFVGYMNVDSNFPNPLYVGANYLWRWNEIIGRWDTRLGNRQMTKTISGVDFSDNYVRAIAVAPSNSNVLYTGTTDGNFWMSTNQGTTWKQLAGLPSRSYTDINVHPSNAFDILVSIGGTGSGHVYRCLDTRLTVPVFTNKSGTGAATLPDVHHSTITRDPSNPNAIFYAGSDQGVFMTADGGTTWSNATEALGMPVCELATLRAMPGTGYLMAATYGRGMWRLPLFPVEAGAPAQIDMLNIQLARDGNTLTGSVTLQNNGGKTAQDVRLRATTIVVGSRIFALASPGLLPIPAGNLAPGATATIPVTYKFDNKIAPGTSATFRATASIALGTTIKTFDSSSAIVVP
jgi:photosystem II stability/assembly factor-like uncharacterized protein